MRDPTAGATCCGGPSETLIRPGNSRNVEMGYRVECTICDYSDEADSFREIFELEEEHKAEKGSRHILRWENDVD